ncbi:hypothetical protein TNCV_3582111 [Trichonephila clavipes]|nr:hypothetical protein TNCV_3582111 [Trichonephila clavipes]
MSSSLVPLKTHRVEGLIHVKSVRAQISSHWCGMVVRRGECQHRCRSCHLTTIQNHEVAAIRDISRSCLDPNVFTVLNCIAKGHASLSPPSLRFRLCSCFTLLATYTYFDPKDFNPHPIDSVKGHASLSPLAQQKAKEKP